MPMPMGNVALRGTNLDRTVDHARRTLGLKVTEVNSEGRLSDGQREAPRAAAIASGANILSEQP
jgi:hypothetical protein